MKPLPAPLEAAFERFWKAYPLRRPNPKVEARKAFARQVEKGADPEELVRAAGGYAVECRRQKIEPAFVVHARTFLRQERWRDYTGEAEQAEPPAARHPELKRRLVPPLSEADFFVWIEPLSFARAAERLTVRCPSAFHRDWVRANYAGVLMKAFGAARAEVVVDRP